jgi:hypothetical protein
VVIIHPAQQHRRRHVLAAVALLGGTFLAIAGCGTSDSTSTQAGPAQSVSLADLADKIHLIAADDCQTRPPATVYPDCARYVAEVAGSAATATDLAPHSTDASTIRAAASRVEDDLATFDGDACAPTLGTASTSTSTCVADLTALRTGVAALDTAVRAGEPRATSTP